MDLNGDGHVDILSGSYSRHDPDMAGLFQVLWGTKDRSFQPPEAVQGSDGQPLIIAAAGKDAVTDKICTRPFAVDLDGDGKLDIVAGNFSGTFAFFAGEGNGRFAPKNTILAADSSPLRVDSHGDPFFVDWDADGDLDLLSGSSQGGVFLFENRGSAKAPKFARKRTLLPARGRDGSEIKLGDAWLTGPQTATRVWVDDVDGDGKLDLLIGDSVSLCYAAEGVDEATVKGQLSAWEAKQQQLFREQPKGQDGAPSAADQKKWDQAYEALQEERKKIVRDERTGFVWLVRQK